MGLGVSNSSNVSAVWHFTVDKTVNKIAHRNGSIGIEDEVDDPQLRSKLGRKSDDDSFIDRRGSA